MPGAPLPFLAREKLGRVCFCIYRWSTSCSRIMAVAEISRAEDFDRILADSSRALTVIHFYAPWAPQCTQMNDVLGELAKDNIHIKFFKLEAENFPEVSLKYEISAVPAFLIFKNQKVVDRLDGANAPELSKKVQHHSSVITPPDVSEKTEKQDLDTRLKKLTHSAPCILFMKGSPQDPRCGFSRQVVEILNHAGVKYSSFDILSDNEVRQGLKKYSNWPTYPQIYVNGELIGGLDILKEMKETDELSTVLPVAEDSLNKRLASLLKSAPVMLFMKGSPEAPKCGFSRQMCDILNNYKSSVEYKSFDILQDQEVRDGLKKYSNWPTYPQLYAKGELVGGLDIIRELHDNGELGDALSGN